MAQNSVCATIIMIFESYSSPSHLDPSDQILRAEFLQFAKENNGAGLSEQEQLARLATLGLYLKYVLSLILFLPE